MALSGTPASPRPAEGDNGAASRPGLQAIGYAEYRYLVLSDLYRITGSISPLAFLKHMLTGRESFRYNFWMRTCRYAAHQPVLKYSLFWFARLMLRRLTYKMGISIPFRTRIGSGFYIGHFGGIIVNQMAVIGRNCNISAGVVVGQANRGACKGCPVLGDNVYIGPGAKIFGAIKIGNNVAIGANAVVTRDVPDNAVVVGIPGRAVSLKGSAGYVNRTDYEDKIG